MQFAVQGGWSRCLGLTIGVLMLVPVSASALTGVSIRDLDDPVTPGGIVSYKMTLSDLTPPGPPAPTCFNPPPDCVLTPVYCANPQPTCEGSTFIGFFCRNAVNEGASCGTTAPDVNLCQVRPAGKCKGGNNDGMPCHVPDKELTNECPGSTLLCIRSANDGDYCGVGNPPTPEPSYCLDGPGVCAGGPNYGFPCTGAHGQPDPTECPPDVNPTPPTPIVLTLPIPTGTTFLDADNGGTSDGTTVTWNIAPLDTCGGLGEAPCPTPIARMTVDPLMPIGSIVRNRARATDGDGFLESGEEKTTIGTFGPSRIGIRYPRRPDRDSLRYRTTFALNPGATINPATEPVDVLITDALGTLAQFTLPAGSLLFRGDMQTVAIWSYRNSLPGLRRLAIALRGTATYTLALTARLMDLPTPVGSTLTVQITIGDDVLVQYLTLRPSRTGRRFVARYP